MDSLTRTSSVLRQCALPFRRPPTVDTSRAIFDERTDRYDTLLEAIGDSDVVLIGEASHGTHEFYYERARITQELITKKGFTFIATEADWPDAYRLNRYVQKGHTCKDAHAEEALGDFRRFPLWMWRNTVVRDFGEWLRSYNEKMTGEKKVAFYGMDLYSMYSSMDSVIEYLQKVDPEDAKRAKRAYSNFDRFQGAPETYGYSAVLGLSPAFEREVVHTLLDLQRKGEEYLKGVGGLIDGDELFYAEQNARLVKNAEEYYRKMYHADAVTWNIRDTHMADCVTSLLDYHNVKHPHVKNKMVIWAHNSHLGDARFTESGQRRDEVNVGQLLRQRFGMDRVFNIGFSTNSGTVTAANEWDEPAHLMTVRHGLNSSYEQMFHAAVESHNQEDRDMLLIFRSQNPRVEVKKELLQVLEVPKLERYIGVIYRPDTERASHYSKTTITKEYDAVIYIDETNAVEPLDPTTTWAKDRTKLAKRAHP